jgi:hypothetical protein
LERCVHEIHGKALPDHSQVLIGDYLQRTIKQCLPTWEPTWP